jgi:hypothetical protein
VHVWFARNEKGALEGLADRSHRPRSTPLPSLGARAVWRCPPTV